MVSFEYLFNPTFLMFLGILMLVVALLVVYFESKIRDQNHKIASMLSLVSTLAEDMNGVKMGLNHLAMTRVGGNFQKSHLEETTQQMKHEENKLIEVSDDDSDDDSDDESDDDNEVSESDVDLESNSDEESCDNVKVLKINITDDINNIDESVNLDLEETESLEDIEEVDDSVELNSNLSDVESENNDHENLSNSFVEKVLDLQYENENDEQLTLTSSVLKKININLDETQHENIDYKKLPLPKLRTIVSEKGLGLDTSKLKKNELLKLLGEE